MTTSETQKRRLLPELHRMRDQVEFKTLFTYKKVTHQASKIKLFFPQKEVR
jgi:hypothetical protein